MRPFFFLSLLSIALVLGEVGAQGQPSNLRTEYNSAPITVDNYSPRFGWEVLTQNAYQIFVFSEAILVWNSGIVESSATAGVEYEGVKLQSDTDYTWIVSSATAGLWLNSSTASFSTALFNQDIDWKGVWIGGSNQIAVNLSLGPAPVIRARAFVTAVGCYELWINGQRISRGGINMSQPDSFINPGISTIYSSRLLYNVYDVANSLVSGSLNELGIRMGSCKYGYLSEFCPGGNASACNRALFQLNILDDTYNRSSVTSGSNWVQSQSPVVLDHFYNGEVYDARIGSWQGSTPVIVMPSPTRVLSAHSMPQVVAYETRSAVSVVAVGSPVSYVFDLGINGAGVCTLTMPGLTAGDNLTITFAELTNVDGSGNAYIQFPCPSACCLDGGNCANQRFTYIARGGNASVESYTPSFSYSGFRYVQVDGWPTATLPTPDLLSCAITSTGVETSGSVLFNGTAEAPILNAIQAAIVRSQRSNLHSIPTDCPQREKRGWMADAHVTAPEASLNLMMAPVYENWLRTHADTLAVGCGGDPLVNCSCSKWHSTQPGTCPSSASFDLTIDTAHPLLRHLDSESSAEAPPNCYICCDAWPGFGCTAATPAGNVSQGAIADVIPFDKNGYGSFPGSICWTSAFFVVADVLLERYNDVQALTSLYPSLNQHFGFYASNARQLGGGLVQWENYGDWNALEESSKLFMANAYFAYDAVIMAKIALAIGLTSDSLAFLAIADSVHTAVGAAYFNLSASYWDTGSQAAQALALAFDLGGGGLQNFTGAVAAHLAADVLSRGTHLTTGCLGGRWLLQALSASGRGDVALALAAQTSIPSWGYMVTSKFALGTLWEGWENSQGEGGSSMNHAFMGGGIGEWFYEFALGLRYRHRRASVSPSLNQMRCAAPSGLNLALLTHKLRLSAREICALSRVVELERSAVAAGSFVSWSALRRMAKDSLKGINEGHVSSSSRVPLAPEAALVLDLHVIQALTSAAGHLDTLYGRLEASWSYVASECPRMSTNLSFSGSFSGAVFVPRDLLLLLSCSRASVLTVVEINGAQSSFSISLADIILSEAANGIPVHSLSWVTSAEVYEQASVLDGSWLRIGLHGGSWALKFDTMKESD